MALFGVLFLVSALAATGYSLSCTDCTSAISNSCTGSSITCPSGSVCGSFYTTIYAAGSTSSSFYRGCTTSSQCNMSGSITITGRNIKLATSCCSTDNCTPSTPVLPTLNSTSNGLVCRTCASADSTWCYTSDTMTCTGNENMCALQTTKLSSGTTSLSTALRGCATKSLCDLGSQSQSAGDVSTDVKFICTSGSVGLRSSFSILAIVCLFYLRLLF